MSTVAEFMILSGVTIVHQCWRNTCMILRKAEWNFTCKTESMGRMILESVENSPLIWPTIEENGMTMTKKYAELYATEKIQADCDMKATNIILQGLPADIYSLERECKLYDAFDKFARIKGESLHNLPPEWSKFVIDVKLVKDLHTTNYDQLHAYLEQHELHANESPPYGSIPPTQHYSTTYPSTPLAISYPSTPYPNAYSYTVHQEACPKPPSVHQIGYTASIVNQQTHLVEFPYIDSGLAVPVFKQGDDPIDAINKMMSFLASSRGDKGKIILVLLIRAMLLVQGEILQVDRQELLDATTANVKEIWLGNALSLSDQGMLHTEDLDTYDSYCDDLSTAKAVLMANISNYGSDIILEVPNSETYLNDMDNQSMQALQDFEQTPVMDFTDNEISSDSNIIPYS
ncbi:hypothetical protein Tco_0491365 [Tanacetum coccineum]